jgi:hypothetical protein
MCVPGQNLWRMVNDICEVVVPCCSVADVLNDCLVNVAITQDMIPYTISEPGVYTLCEEVTVASSSPAITIAANNVVLNLNSNTIYNEGGRGVSCSGSFTNITITNGFIQSDAEAIYVYEAADVVISDIEVISAANTAIRIDTVTGVIVDRCICLSSNDVPTDAFIDGAINFNAVGNGYISDCQVYSQAAAGFVVSNPTNIVEVVRCDASGCDQWGFYLYQDAGILLVVMRDAVASQCTIGFSITGGTTAVGGPVLERCTAYSCTQEGFLIDSITNGELRSCSAVINKQNGYQLSTVSTYLLENCMANDNSFNGFYLSGPGTNTKVTMNYCTASNNLQNGFYIAAGSETVLANCLASLNLSTGINNAGTNTFIVDCRSSYGATDTNPAYNLNGVADVVGTATEIIIS